MINDEVLTRFTSYITEKSNESSFCRHEDNLSIYRNNFIYGHLKVLKNIFKSIQLVLGEENFSYFSYLYIKSLQESSENIDEFGNLFPSFLEDQEQLKEMPFLKDMAKIDLLFFGGDINETISLYSGSLGLWSKLINGEELEGIEIDPEVYEEIFFVTNDEEMKLIARVDV